MQLQTFEVCISEMMILVQTCGTLEEHAFATKAFQHDVRDPYHEKMMKTLKDRMIVLPTHTIE